MREVLEIPPFTKGLWTGKDSGGGIFMLMQVTEIKFSESYIKKKKHIKIKGGSFKRIKMSVGKEEVVREGNGE